MPSGCLGLLLLLALLVLLPFLFTEAMLDAMGKLGLSEAASTAAVVAILLGGLVNVPVRRLPREEAVDIPPFGLFGFDWMAPRLHRRRAQTVIAVNVGGCVVPCLLAAHQLLRLVGAGASSLLAGVAAIGINTAVCYAVARPIPNVGIAMPPLAPALVAVACGLVFSTAATLAPAVAFVAGVLGPLLGADLLRIREVSRITTGVASIGGAGTFDGIVLSGLLATLLTPKV